MTLRFSLFLLLLLLFLCCKEKEASVEVAVKAAAITQKSEGLGPVYEDLEGNGIALENYKGQRVLLNYWATWCRPCIEEMPSLLSLQEQLSAENYVFLLASDQTVKTIRDFKAKKGFDFNFIKYNGAYPDLGINALPVTIIYNTKGEEVERITGATLWDAPKMVQKLKAVQ